ncbi:MAG: FkbM family methyltransferase, partial [Rhodospirillaceae bacterium]
YEKLELDIISEFLDKNMTEFDIALDVGANIGNHTVRFLAPKFEKVYCYEPNEVAFNLLSVNTNMLSNVFCFKFGLSEKSAELNFKENKTNIGASFIISDNILNISNDVYKKVQVRSLDDENIKGKVSLIKLDIEGHEIYFLKGAAETIKRNKPTILFEEGLIDESGSSAVIEYLRDFNYEFYTVSENFYFGDSKFQRLARYLLQDSFGIKAKIMKTEKFSKRFHHLIIAKPKD